MNPDKVMSVELTLEYYKSAVRKMFTPEKPVKLYTAGELLQNLERTDIIQYYLLCYSY